ncbi:hypothetical protein LCGC14_1902990 [marine sediment metagenome]|uniref:Uncharacterized protein n=1 Tax=marine sediment metagenome TaxID=412755 RepID=A0A0F9FW09_9ZZZZ
MNLCEGTRNDTHPEVCFDDRNSCPACEIREELEGKVRELEHAIELLEAEV